MTTGLEPKNRHTGIVTDNSNDPANFIVNSTPDGQTIPSEETQEAKKTIESEETQASTPTQEISESTSDGSLPTLEELELDEELQTKTEKPEETQDVNFDFELPDDESAKKFREAFNKYLGFDISELKTYASQYQSAIAELNKINAQNYIQQSVNNLANDWGVPADEVNTRLEMVRERFKNYSPEMQARLDNVEGAKLIWSRIENESLTKGKNIPTFNSGKRTATNNRAKNRMFTQAEIDKMSVKEYNENYNDILFAYQNGLVS